MFENLLAQDEALALLRSDYATGALPPSLLFSGPANSGKLTAALELARGLSCEAPAPGAWNCACPACERHRALLHSDLLLLGPKSFIAEIAAAADLLARAPTQKAARFFFIRSLRKLMARFSPVLFDGEEGRLSKAVPLLQDLDALADEADPERVLEAAKAELLGKKTLPLASKLEAHVSDAIPIFQIRALERWMRLAPSGKAKTIIIENADRMLDGARNALLKALEEPPSRVRFILCAERRGALIPTILSRSRSYRFRPRDVAASRLVLEKVFRLANAEGLSLDAYLAALGRCGKPSMDQAARDLVAALLAERAATQNFDPAFAELAGAARMDVGQAIAAAREASGDFGKGDEGSSWIFARFLESFSLVLRELLRAPGSGPESLALAERWNALLAEARRDWDVFNLPPAGLLERLAAGARRT